MERITKVCTLVLAALWALLHFPLHAIACAKESPIMLHSSDQAHISTDLSTISQDCGMPDDAPELRPPVPVLPPVMPFFNDMTNQRPSPPRQTVYDFGGSSSMPLTLRALSEKPASTFITVK